MECILEVIEGLAISHLTIEIYPGDLRSADFVDGVVTGALIVGGCGPGFQILTIEVYPGDLRRTVGVVAAAVSVGGRGPGPASSR